MSETPAPSTSDGAFRPRIVVFTAITGVRDALNDDQCGDGASFVAFVDRPWKSSLWIQQPAYDRFHSLRRNSRVHKILAHQYIDAEYSIWIDGNISLRIPAAELISRWLADVDLAVFKHHARDCLYAEAAVCAERGLDSRDLISAQVLKYREEKIRPEQGLGECCVVLRRHTAAVERFNNFWWSEYSRFSVRDQISFMYAVTRSGVRHAFIEPDKHHHAAFRIRDRPAEKEA